MELYAEILNGKRRGNSFRLPLVGEAAVEAIPYVLETEAIAFHLKVDEPCDHVELMLEQLNYSMHPQMNGDDSCIYSLLPNRTLKGYYETLFFNYFGLASLALKVSKGGETIIYEVCPFEVLARQLSADQAERMLTYLLRDTEADLLKALGATRLGADPNGSGDNPEKLLEQLLQHIALLEDVAPYIAHRPLTALTARAELVDGVSVDAIDENGVGWLLENLSVLEETDNPDKAHLENDGIYLSAAELQTTVIREDTDILENRALHGYVRSMQEFVHELLSGYQGSEYPTSNNSHDGYVSFFTAMQRWIGKLAGIRVESLRDCELRLRKLDATFCQYLPVRQDVIGIPQFSQRIKSNTHYLTVFKSASSWYQRNKIDWRTHQMLLAINSVPKLWEYYTVVRMQRWCKRFGEGISSSCDSLWSGSFSNWTAHLYYEPYYWMTGHRNAGVVVNSQLRSAIRARQDYPGRIRQGEYNRRVPDIIIELRPPEDSTLPTKLLAFDAKYTSREKAFEHYLPDVTLKYVHGISHKSQGACIESMLVLYPDVDDALMDFHAHPYNLFGSRPHFPVLGAQAMSLGHGDEESHWQFERTLERLIELAIDRE